MATVTALLDRLPDLVQRGDLFEPKYTAAYHLVCALAEIDAARDDPRLLAALDACLAAGAKSDGGFDLRAGKTTSHFCITGNLVRASWLLGLGDDPRVASAVAWLERVQRADGGWNCFDGEPSSLEAWEALGAFAAMPRERRPKHAVARGVEWLLSEKLGVEDPYAPWRRIHFPRHHYYDLLVGLELATTLGDPRDARLASALAWLRTKRGADGRWRVEATHPDIDVDAEPEWKEATIRWLAPIVPLEIEGADAWVARGAERVERRVAER